MSNYTKKERPDEKTRCPFFDVLWKHFPMAQVSCKSDQWLQSYERSKFSIVKQLKKPLEGFLLTRTAIPLCGGMTKRNRQTVCQILNEIWTKQYSQRKFPIVNEIIYIEYHGLLNTQWLWLLAQFWLLWNIYSQTKFTIVNEILDNE